MNKILQRGARKSLTAKINKRILKGFSMDELTPEMIIKYMDTRLRGIFTNTKHGFNYVSMERCSVEEQTAVLTKSSNGGAKYDVAKSDLCLYKFMFTFQGSPMDTKYLLLPYLEPGDICTLSNSPYNLSQVLTDKALSPSSNNIFIRLLRDKITAIFNKYSYMKNGNMELVSVVSATIYRAPPQGPIISKAASTLMHYLLSRFGLTKTLKLALGDKKIPKVMYLQDASKKGFIGNSKYTVYTSRGVRPAKTYMDRSKYEPTKICFIIPKDMATRETDMFIGNFFYVLDHKPELTISELENPAIWRIVLGEIIFGGIPHNRLVTSTENHLESLDYYVDEFMVQQLYNEFGDSLKEDFSKDGFYKVLLVVLRRFDVWRQSAGTISSSCYDKRLEILYFLTYNLFISFNELSRELTQAHRRFLNKAMAQKKLNFKITLRKIFKMTDKNPSCQLIIYGGDHKYFKITSRQQLQLHVTGSTLVSKQKMGSQVDASTLLDSTHGIGGTLCAISDSRLSPLAYTNMFLPYDEKTKTIIPPKYLREKIKPLRDVLRLTPRNANKPTISKEFNRFVED